MLFIIQAVKSTARTAARCSASAMLRAPKFTLAVRVRYGVWRCNAGRAGRSPASRAR